MPEPLNVAEYERLAEGTLEPGAFGYFAGGAGDERVLAENLEAWRRLRLRPRVLVDVAETTTETTVLGTPVSMPLLVAPTAIQRMAHPDGEAGTARAAAAAGTVMCVSTLATTTLEDVAAAAPAAGLWFQLYVFRDRGITRSLVERAAAAGYDAIVLTVDAPRLGRRERDLRTGFRIPPEVTVPSFAAAAGGWSGATPLEILSLIDPTLSWRDLEQLVEESPLPVLVKGVQTAEDATLACEHGAAAVVVSNHGGRQLDDVAPTAELLPEVVEAVDGRVEVLVDGGIRRGSDVVKALALGARAALVGRPVLWGLAVDGERGVARVLALLRDELAPVTDLAGLTRNAVDVLPAGALEEKLKRGRPLRVKLGIDVTSPDIHVGRGVPLQRMRAFQDAGHLGVLIVGDYTTRIGDPSGRSTERPLLTEAEIDANARTYVEQAHQLLDPERTEVRFNSEWLAPLDFAEILRLTRTTTVAQLLERDDFSKRFAAREPISISELLYPLMQAYDSVAVEADVELGGTDQLYNLLAGRTVQEAYGQEPQVVLTVPLLLSWDGAKMSSSVGNNIPLTAPPEEQFGRTMRIPDSLLPEWYRLVWERGLPRDADPMRAKLDLARFVVARSHGDAAADAAEAHFTRVVREGLAPDDVPEAVLPPGDPVHVPAALAAAFGISTSDARRLLAGGGVKVDGALLRELDVERATLLAGTVQAGKRRFVRFTEPGRSG